MLKTGLSIVIAFATLVVADPCTGQDENTSKSSLIEDPVVEVVQEYTENTKARSLLDTRSEGLAKRLTESAAAQDEVTDSRTFGAWPKKPITDIKIDIRQESDTLPKDYSEQLVNAQTAAWNDFVASSKLFAWEAPNIRYQPLYFEDVALERYGQTYCGVRQWARSTIHFATAATLFNYHKLIDHPRSCDYPLGFCRPGSCGPPVYQKQWFGF